MAVYDLTVYAKTENLLYRLYPVLINFPKSEKFSLCTQIKDKLKINRKKVLEYGLQR